MARRAAVLIDMSSKERTMGQRSVSIHEERQTANYQTDQQGQHEAGHGTLLKGNDSQTLHTGHRET